MSAPMHVATEIAAAAAASDLARVLAREARRSPPSPPAAAKAPPPPGAPRRRATPRPAPKPGTLLLSPGEVRVLADLLDTHPLLARR